MIYREYILLIKSSCPYCQEAKDLLESLEINHQAIDLETVPEVLQQFKDVMEHNTVPIVLGSFGAGCYKLIGGCDDLKRTLVVEDE
jgi:glutaredoxin